MPDKPEYVVRVWYDVRDSGHTFGSFNDRKDAEDCVKVLAARVDVVGAEIQKGTD